MYGQIKDSERHHPQAQTQVPNPRVGNKNAKNAKTEVVLSMLARQAHHTIYLATLFGSFDWEKTADCGVNGSLIHRALPALRQLADVLTRFLPSWPGFVWGWVPMFLEQDFFSGIPEYSTSREVTASCEVVVPVSTELFFEDVQGSRLHQCSESLQGGNVFYTKPECTATGVQRLSVSRASCVRGASLFLPQRSRRMVIIAAISSTSFVRNRGVLTRATFLQDDLR